MADENEYIIGENEPLTFFSHETRCRRCGGFADWPFGNITHSTYRRMVEVIAMRDRELKLLDCRRCDKPTIQDSTAYTTISEPPRFDNEQAIEA